MKVLDHGYIKKIGHWGSDEGIIEAARMSTDKGFKGWGPFKKCSWCGVKDGEQDPGAGCKTAGQDYGPDHAWVDGHVGDEKLLRYLWANKHATPFEMAGLTIEVQAPIFVFRQWHRHRTQSYNEMSARYTPLPPMDYVPTVERLMAQSSKNKQAGKAKGAGDLDRGAAVDYQSALRSSYESAQQLYVDALAMGVPKELARLHLPVARYSRMRASANLRNWLGFLTLRLDPHAQYEIRVYAEAVGEMIKEAFPRTWELFAEGLR